MSKAIELREQRAKLVADANALVPSDMKLFTSELRTKVETMLADAKGLDSLIVLFEQEEERNEETRAKNLNFSNSGSSESSDNEEVKAGFRSYLRTGKSESRDLVLSADGILVPTFVAQLAIAKKSPGSIYNLVGKMATSTGAPVKVPYWNDLANSWVLNSAGLATTAPAVTAGPTITPDDLRFQPLKLDNSLVQDAAFDNRDADSLESGYSAECGCRDCNHGQHEQSDRFQLCWHGRGGYQRLCQLRNRRCGY
jgi:HK97 family phage major capsid protein